MDLLLASNNTCSESQCYVLSIAIGKGEKNTSDIPHSQKNMLEETSIGTATTTAASAILSDSTGVYLKNPSKILSTKLRSQKNSTVTEIPEEEIQGNPIGMLQELCMMRRWMPPEYSTEQEEGLPHERLFTILCTVRNFKEYGIGRSKKLAKRQSAHKMVQKILTVPAEDENLYKNFEDEDEVIERFTNQKTAGRVTSLQTAAGISRKISQFHRNLKSLNGNKTEKLKALDLEEYYDRNSNNDASAALAKLLKDVAAENKIEVTYVVIEEKTKAGKFQCLVQLSTVPVAVCHGTASTIAEAQKNATYNSLKYIKLLCT